MFSCLHMYVRNSPYNFVDVDAHYACHGYMLARIISDKSVHLAISHRLQAQIHVQMKISEVALGAAKKTNDEEMEHTFWMLAEYRSNRITRKLTKFRWKAFREASNWRREEKTKSSKEIRSSQLAQHYVHEMQSMPGMPQRTNAFWNRCLCYDWVDDLLAFSSMQNEINRLNIDADDDCTLTATNYTLYMLYLSMRQHFIVCQWIISGHYTHRSRSRSQATMILLSSVHISFFLCNFFFRFSVLRIAHFVRECVCVCCKLCVQLLNGSGGGGNIRCGEDEKKAIEIMCAHKRR